MTDNLWKSIGEIGNYYGGLQVVKSGKRYFWTIEDYKDSYEEEIPKSLYDELTKFNNSKLNK